MSEVILALLILPALAIVSILGWFLLLAPKAKDVPPTRQEDAEGSIDTEEDRDV